MNYRGRVMELSLDWSGADLRCMAAEMAAEADQEIARLRDALDTLTLVVGLTAFKHEGQRAPLQEAMDKSRAALAQAAEVSE